MDPSCHFPDGSLIPDDGDQRSLLADLIESADPARAELIRIQLEIERTPRAERSKAQFKRQNELIEAHGVRWAGTMAKQVLDFHFRGGFIHRVLARWPQCFAHGGEWAKAHPIRDLILLGEPGISDGLNTIKPAFPFPQSSDPGWAGVNHLFQGLDSLEWGELGLSKREEAMLLDRGLPRLQRLVLRDLGTATMETLKKTGLWNRLSHLELTNQRDVGGLRELCLEVGREPDHGPLIGLGLVGQKPIAAVIQSSRYAGRFVIRQD